MVKNKNTDLINNCLHNIRIFIACMYIQIQDFLESVSILPSFPEY